MKMTNLFMLFTTPRKLVAEKRRCTQTPPLHHATADTPQRSASGRGSAREEPHHEQRHEEQDHEPRTAEQAHASQRDVDQTSVLSPQLRKSRSGTAKSMFEEIQVRAPKTWCDGMCHPTGSVRIYRFCCSQIGRLYFDCVSPILEGKLLGKLKET